MKRIISLLSIWLSYYKNWQVRRRASLYIKSLTALPSYRDNTHLGVVTDLTGHILHFNPLAQIFFQTTPDKLVNRNLSDYLESSDRLIFHSLLALRRRPQPYLAHGIRLLGLEDTTLLRMFCNPEHGFCVCLFESMQVTEEVLVAREERKWAERLQIMLFGISHELKTPLAVARGYTEMLTEDLGDLETTQRLMDSLNRISLILNDMTEPLKELRSGQEVIDLGKGIELYTRTMTYIEPAKRYIGEFEADITEALGKRIKMNKPRFYQVLTNLFDNAIRATDHLEEDARIRITTHKCSKPHHQNCIVVEFSDNGVGMSVDVAQKVFAPYFTTRAANTGSGLGGYFIYQYVLDAGGTIEVRSVEGEGTSFLLHLPYLT